MWNQQPLSNQSPGHKKFRILRLVLTSTGTYNPQYRRPWNTRGDGQAVKMLAGAIDGVSMITPQKLAAVANMIVEPQAMPEVLDPNVGAQPIPMVGDGWTGNRLTFMMVIEYTGAVGATVREVISGYTNHHGVSVGGFLDPQMLFFVNSVMIMRHSEENNVFGSQTYSTILDNSLILTDNQFNNFGGTFNPNAGHHLRPEDVFTTMTTSHMDRSSLVDTRTMHESQPKKSYRRDNLSAHYMSSILQGWKQAQDQVDPGAAGMELFEKARGLTQNQPIMRDPFFQQLEMQSSEMLSNCFTLSMLEHMDPNVRSPQVLQVTTVGPTEMAGMHFAGQSEYWHAPTLTTKIATQLSNTIPALMTELGIQSLGVFASNKNFGLEWATQSPYGRTTIDVVGPQSIVYTDMRQACETFKQRLYQEVLQGVFHFDELAYEINMTVNLAIDSILDISINNEPTVRYVTPSFCDALLAPVTTQNNQLVTDVADAFQTLSAVISHAAPNTPWAQGAGGNTLSPGNRPLSF